MNPPQTESDGPYIFQKLDGGLQALWLYEGHLWQRHWSTAQAADVVHVAARYGYRYSLLIDIRQAPQPIAAIQPETGCIIAISDIHGEYERARHLLRVHGVINTDDDWIAGKVTLVVVGDTVDCGNQVTQSLWLLYRLQQQASVSGGAVHVLHGNHESMLLSGDQSYLHPCYLRNARLLGRNYGQLYAADSVLGQWLRTWPLLLRIGDTLFVHGGIHLHTLDLARDLEATNTHWRNSLGKSVSMLENNPYAARLHDCRYGPAWYFGYFDNSIDTVAVRYICRDLGIQRIVVGHATVPHISRLYHGQVIAIDCGLWQGMGGELLFIEDQRLSRGLADGSRHDLVNA